MQLELICPSSSFIGGGGVWPAVMCAFAPMIARGGPTRGVLAGVWTEDLLQFSEILSKILGIFHLYPVTRHA